MRKCFYFSSEIERQNDKHRRFAIFLVHRKQILLIVDKISDDLLTNQ